MPLLHDVMELTCEGPLTQQMTEPGQFLHLRIDATDDLLLRRPISICDVDQDQGQVTMLYRVEGKGTARLAEKLEGMELDVLGPLGNGFPLEATKQGETALLSWRRDRCPSSLLLIKAIKSTRCKCYSCTWFSK